ncbi:MAG: bifunctional phosphopantothenoylcysteine decarboxylase/phosphopantothenate--cysteine ligase CoaBC [Velocimicrobium sp.]
MLKGKNVVLAVTGSIAAYKIANLASLLMKQHCKVTVLMTKNATNFIHPITFETLTGNKCLIDTFDRSFQYSVEHVSLAKETDLIMVAPASANVIAKLAHGIADDMLTTTILACECPKLVAPTMNTHMYHNPIVQDNIKQLKRYGMKVIKPDTGYLACGDIGEGKMPSEEILLSYIIKYIAYEKDLKGKKVMVTAGPTREALDPVRFISNHSTGKMGYAIAKDCMLRGAEVTLITGPTTIKTPDFVKVIPVVSAQDMFMAVKDNFMEQNIIIKAAAVSDYRPVNVAEEKVKKTENDITLALEKTTDILQFLGDHRIRGQILCGFSMETENMVENSRKKLEKKKADLIIANNLKVEGAGFGTDTNIVTLLTKDEENLLPLLSKKQIAHMIMDKILEIEKKQKGTCI